MKCRTCNLPVIDPDDFKPGRDSYHDTPGGHADRHTAVLEAAEKAACSTCTWPNRETTGLVCQACGWDYANGEKP